MAPKPCIYCPNPADGEEHWIPASLGEFRDVGLLLDTICTPCNEQFGRTLDQEFIRTGPEGIFRARLGIQGRRGTDGGSPFYYKAATTHPVQVVEHDSQDDGHDALLWEVEGDAKGKPLGRLLRQVLVQTPEGRRTAVPINLAWRPDTLRQALQTRGLQGSSLVAVYVDPDEVNTARALLSAVFGRFEAQLFARDGEISTRTMRFKNEVSRDYFRAVAKIGFHTALKLLPHLVGHEFPDVRAFIKDAVAPSFRVVSAEKEPIVAGIGEGVTFEDWAHVVAVEATPSRVVTRLQFFVGPRMIPPTWRIDLGPNRSRILGRTSKGVVLRYFPDGPQGRFAGELIPLTTLAR